MFGRYDIGVSAGAPEVEERNMACRDCGGDRDDSGRGGTGTCACDGYQVRTCTSGPIGDSMWHWRATDSQGRTVAESDDDGAPTLSVALRQAREALRQVEGAAEAASEARYTNTYGERT